MMTLMAFPLPLPAIHRQIASGVDLLIHLGRLQDRSRRVLEIAEIDGILNDEVQTRTIFRYDDAEQRLVRTGELKHTLKLVRSGYAGDFKG